MQGSAASLKKAVVIVGVSYAPGLGFAIAKRFAKEGLAVGMVGRQQERLEACKSEILKEVPDAQVNFAMADATDPEQCARAFTELNAVNGNPDALVMNMAARPAPMPMADLSPDKLLNDWKTGPYAALLCCQQVLPAMRKAGSGTILFTGATASLRGSAKFGSFAASKCSVRAMAQSLAKELSPEGIHVAHIIVDSMVDMPLMKSMAASAPPGKFLDTDSAAEVYWNLYQQNKLCFAFEVDIRPHECSW